MTDLSTFRQGGFAFVYPGNWELVEPQFDDLPYSVTASSPDGAFWSLAIYPISQSPETLVEQAVEAIRAEYENVEVTSFVPTMLPEFEAVGREMTFICLDFVVVCRATAFRRGRSTCLIHRQAETRDYDRLDAVFAAMTESFLRDGQISFDPD